VRDPRVPELESGRDSIKMADDVTFIFLNDLHIGTPGDPNCTHYPASSRMLEAALRRLHVMQPSPSFLVVAGDLANRGDVSGYVELRRIFHEANLGVPVFFALGNHDDRRNFYEVMLERTDDVEAPYYHAQVVSGIHVIVLDSEMPLQPGGALDEAQWEWLAAELDRNPECPKLLVMHHAPALSEDDGVIPRFFTLHLADTARLQKLLAGRNILGILCGHVHLNRFSQWYGIPVVLGLGTSGSGGDPVVRNTMLRPVPGASFGIGVIRPSGLTITVVPETPIERTMPPEQSFDSIRALQARMDAQYLARFGTEPPGKF